MNLVLSVFMTFAIIALNFIAYAVSDETLVAMIFGRSILFYCITIHLVLIILLSSWVVFALNSGRSVWPALGLYVIACCGVIAFHATIYSKFGLRDPSSTSVTCKEVGEKIGGEVCKRAGDDILIPTNSWATALYFSTVTWTTLGYGDIAPTPAIRLIAALEALFGVVFMGILTGIIVAILVRQ